MSRVEEAAEPRKDTQGKPKHRGSLPRLPIMGVVESFGILVPRRPSAN